jgi:broad specificity phosphatase PhoE
MAIYIRHAKDRRRKHDRLFDTSLTDSGEKDAAMLGKQLMRTYGRPHAIYCSPFRRTRQTAKMMASAIGEKVPIYIDVDLSRFPGTGTSYDDKVRDDTKKYGFPDHETRREFKDRVKDHLAESIGKCQKHPKRVYWYVTHAIFVKMVSKLAQVPSPGHLHSRDWINVKTRETSWKQQV